MSDDRFTAEQRAIDEAAKRGTAPELPAVCGAVGITGNRCELGKGHVGQCRFTYPNGAEERWVRHVDADEIEEFAERLRR